MRRWWGVAGVGAVAAVVLGACGGPVGLDDDLTDDWAAIGPPTVWTPQSGICHPQLTEDSLSTYQPVDCALSHRAETIQVGRFTGGDADRASAPPSGSSAARAAHADCDRQATALLGADWRTGRLGLALLLPRAAAWAAGARWYRCDLYETRSLDDDTAVQRTGGLRSALTGPSPLRHTCFIPRLIGDDVNYMDPVGCDQPHRVEFAGLYRAPESTFEVFERNSTRTHHACLSIIAAFAKVPDNDDLGNRLGSIFYHPDAAAWAAGDRGVQCFLWVGDRDLTRSVKGAGPAALPAA